MSLIARHKKPGAFRKLVNSLEITPQDRRTKILNAMRAEDPDFVTAVEKCLFEFSEFKNLSEMILADVVYAMKDDMRSVAIALYKCKDEELLNKFMKSMLPAQGSAFKEEMSMLTAITVGQQKGAQFKVIEKARELQENGVVTIKEYAPQYT